MGISRSILRLVERKAFPIYFGEACLRDYLHRKRALRDLGNGVGFQPLYRLPVASYVSSDTLFILGSGSSVNDIDDEQWALIRRHDSLGFNYWALHDFVPTFLFFETPVTPLNSSPLIVDTLIARSADYRRTPVVLKDVQCPGNYYQALDRLARHFPGNLYLALKRKIPGSRPDTLAKGLRYLEYLGEFEVDRPLRRLFQRQGTLSCAVLFGVKLGYKTIVLCGIDLNNTSYFFEEESAYYEDKGLRIPPNMNIAGRHKVHRTFDATLNPLTIDKVLAVIDTVLLSPRGIGLFVASRRSALYPRIPAFF